MALKCYPLLPGGLIAIESVAIGMTSSHHVYKELLANFEVISLLMFMVAGIYFMQELLFTIFSKIFLKIRSKIAISLTFLLAAAFLSAFLDALTVIAVIISVSYAFYSIAELATNHQHVSGAELEEFKGFLRNILMHSGIGTALGGVATMVGEPQNLIIASKVNWDFITFIKHMMHVSLPCIATGIITCYLLEKLKLKQFGFGYNIPQSVVDALSIHLKREKEKRSELHTTELTIQGIVGVLLIAALSFHVAEVGLIGLAVIILVTSFSGVTSEHKIGQAFQEAMPFTALLAVFFTIVAVIVDQQLFAPIMKTAMSYSGSSQISFFFIANGILSAISDNVFVGSVYINEVKALYDQGLLSRHQLDELAIAINAGTNLPSIITPNGQAAFLFLLTSKVAPKLQLSYGRMVGLALPYAVTVTIVAYLATYYGYQPT